MFRTKLVEKMTTYFVLNFFLSKVASFRR